MSFKVFIPQQIDSSGVRMLEETAAASIIQVMEGKKPDNIVNEVVVNSLK
ncbi:hypothetical protein [Alteribacillus sp. HJP-4]